ncbi:unnamed protein product, partial [Ixodes persulcatus]
EAVCGGARVRGGTPLSRAHRLGVWRLLGQGARTLPGGPRRARTAHARHRPYDRGVVVCSAKPASAFRRNGIIDRRRGLGRSCPPTRSLRPTVLPAGRVATRSRRRSVGLLLDDQEERCQKTRERRRTSSTSERSFLPLPLRAASGACDYAFESQVPEVARGRLRGWSSE